MPPRPPMKGPRKAKDPKKTIASILSYLKTYRTTMIVVVICIVLSAGAMAVSAASLGTLVDDYITPLLSQAEPDFGPLLKFLCLMALIYVVGIASSFLYNYLMVEVGQGTQKVIRDEMFSHMQKLPIRYFDTHPTGDIMSRYTSDIDTLRMMLSQSVPQCISSIATLVLVFMAMLFTSPILTVILIFTVTGVVFVTTTVVGKSAGFFMGQQKSLGKVNGFVEEMIHGQHVVKVFCHEDTCKREFDELNETLRVNAYKAGAWSNMMGPVNNNLGYIQYAILAIAGGLIAISSDQNLLTLGNLVAFLILSRSFNQPISQVSNQINSIVMALAGAERIFELIDEPEEEDHGYVTLVYANIAEDGTVTESPVRTGQWAWKHPHSDGT